MDNRHWCESCRRQVIRRAMLWGHGIALSTTLLLGAWIVFNISPERTPVVIWLVLLAMTYFFILKFVRRIAFEIVRGRGVPPMEA